MTDTMLFDTVALPDADDDVLTLDQVAGFGAQRVKTTYNVGETTLFDVERDGRVLQGFIDLSNVRLQRLQVRVQKNRHKVNQLTVRMQAIADDEVVGLIHPETGEKVPHPLYTLEQALYNFPRTAPGEDPQPYVWNNRERKPHRFDFNQWMALENYDQIMALAEALRPHGWQVIYRDPDTSRARRGRTTVDVIEAFPDTRGLEDRRSRDIQLDSFEVNVNKAFANEQGFRDFVSGLDEILHQYVAARGHNNPELRKEALASLDPVINHLSGIYQDGERRWRARPIDVGVVAFGGEEYALYKPGGGDSTRLTSKFDALIAANEQVVAASKNDDAAAGDETDETNEGPAVPTDKPEFEVEF